MKKLSAILLSLAMIPSTFALNLQSDTGVEILAIDGVAKDTRVFSKEKEINLKPGTYQIVARYSTRFHDESPLSSDPTVLTLDLQEDTVISAVKFKSHRVAKKEIEKNTTWKILSPNKEYLIKDADTLKGKGFMPFGNIEKLIATYNQENNIVLAESAPLPELKTTDIEAKPTKHNGQENALIMQYQNASLADKKEFRLWLLEQDMK